MIDSYIYEAELTSEERNNLPKSKFGLPNERKFPLTDGNHVRSAISYFHTCPDSKKPELAKRIRNAAKKFKIEISEDSDVMKW